MHTNVQVDHYIANASEFAIPILEHIRRLVHLADARIEEKIKWGMPFFDYKGSVCHMAAFKNHCALGFWKAALIPDDQKIFKEKSESMGGLGKITSLKDLPADEVLIAYIQAAIQLNEEGIKVAKIKPVQKEVVVPGDLLEELKKDPRAMAVFQNFSSSNRREYVQWIEEAKTEETRTKRLETAVDWIAEGKTRNWKYKK